MGRCAAWLLAAVVALTSAPANATTVILVRVSKARAATRWRAAENHMRDELLALGLQVAEVQPRDAGTDAMRTVLAEHAADAAVQITRSGKRASVTVWLAEPAPRAPRTVAVAVDGGEHPGVAMLRAAELVRAQILGRDALDEPAPIPESETSAAQSEPTPAGGGSSTAAGPAAPVVPVAPAPLVPPTPAAPTPPLVPPTPTASTPPTTPQPREATPPNGEPQPDFVDETVIPVAPDDPESEQPGPLQQPPPTADQAPPTSAPATRRHGFVVAATLGGGSIGALTGLELEGWRELSRRLDFGGGVTSLVTPTWRPISHGSVLLGVTSAHLSLALRVPLGARTSLRLAAAGGLAIAWAVGRAEAPYRGVSDARPAGTLSAALALVVRINPRTSLHLGATCDLVLPPMIIRSGGTESARLGVPLVRGVLGVAWDWPLRR